ncbi:putative FAD(NAD)-dependent oxidoreductase [Fructilactobacillus florum 8D]|uniref:Putative FAD(NAD)-dependent oxidoreductase n=1 Tax=Fructilactobacillus florum 8D TaxID=1221538 RepID=W9EM87_9LACO|nr:FAD/NAD(P)-binding protein [Fructilactobacillus florum]EKK20610.1 putative FAD(NAD)-dependent oxidoreductase [Fructilactobacillus florum 2F]ETO40784.1 putative FAD(NAD)-dependent oxidoreductase [Fructilactobacillus florum 8D]
MHIGIIGAGPRGLILLADLLQAASQTGKLSISLFDPNPIGGKVWSPTQPLDYIMNSPAQLVTLFNDNQPGANFYEWTQSKVARDFVTQENYQHDFLALMEQLQPNDYAPRALFGVYCQWFYRQQLNRLVPQQQVTYLPTTVTAAQPTSTGFILVTPKQQINVNKLVISSGNVANQLTKTEQALQDYATAHQLTYLGPNHPNEVDLTNIKPKTNVIIRGMGLSFFDYLSQLTTARGGRFTRSGDHGLTYHPSGQEPHIIAGSRRGVPYYPKPINQAQVGEQRPAIFLNPAHIQQGSVAGKLPFKTFINLVQAEIENVYYRIILQNNHPQSDVAEFSAGFAAAADRTAFLNNYHWHPGERLDWKTILNPVAGTKITNIADYQQTLQTWLAKLVADARQGSNHAPITGALATLIDLRTTIQRLVTDQAFTDRDYVEKFLPSFNSFAGFLTAGPPVARYDELMALMRAGIVTILGPQLQVVGVKHQFLARSKFYPDEPFLAQAIIEARLPSANLKRTTNSLLVSLRKQGIITAYQFHPENNETVTSGAVKTDLSTYHPINQQGKPNDQLYVWGVPLSGIEWMTTTLPHPAVHDHNFSVADLITEQLLANPAASS